MAKKQTEIRSVVYSFRVDQVSDDALTAMRDNDPIVGVKSNKQFARKIVKDYIAGRLVYKHEKDKLGDLDAVS